MKLLTKDNITTNFSLLKCVMGVKKIRTKLGRLLAHGILLWKQTTWQRMWEKEKTCKKEITNFL